MVYGIEKVLDYDKFNYNLENLNYILKLYENLGFKEKELKLKKIINKIEK